MAKNVSISEMSLLSVAKKLYSFKRLLNWPSSRAGNLQLSRDKFEHHAPNAPPCYDLKTIDVTRSLSKLFHTWI